MECLKLYLVTDSNILKGREFYYSVEEALKGGVTMLQLREKEASGKEFLEKALKLREITRKYGVKFIINDRVDIALMCEADGVHIGQSDLPAKNVRELIGMDKILGVSACSIEEAVQGEIDGADYLGVGAMFSTGTKLDATNVSIETLKEIKSKVRIPIVAIGGINLENLYKLNECNIEGYAIVSAILKADDIKLECEKWIKSI